MVRSIGLGLTIGLALGAIIVLALAFGGAVNATPPVPNTPLDVNMAERDVEGDQVAAGYRQQETRTYCREFQLMATIGGQPAEMIGTACMRPDGVWEIAPGFALGARPRVLSTFDGGE
jgi:hypothetical protein